jgi:hypothetical protein
MVVPLCFTKSGVGITLGRPLQEKKRQEVLAEKDELVNDRSKLELKKMRAHQVPTATPPSLRFG